MTYEITSKKSGYTQFVSEDEWKWLKEHKLSRNYHVKEVVSFKLPTINKQILKPVIEKPIIEKVPKSKTKK